MSIDGAPLDGSLEVSSAAPTVVFAAPASWPWRRAALFLAGAAQLITISALVGADPIPVTWSSLLLAVAPVTVAAAAANPSHRAADTTRAGQKATQRAVITPAVSTTDSAPCRSGEGASGARPGQELTILMKP